MFSLDAIEEWQRQVHGPRVQVKALSYITKQLELFDLFADEAPVEMPSMAVVFKECHQHCVPDVSVSSIRRWWKIYEEWGEIPSRVAERKKRLNSKYKYAKRNKILNDSDALILKGIVDENPNLYLDELSFLF